ncbi:FlxA-like family protein [Gorillibacterium sp. CAU 1737]|uniref:FlxA-like family protein n=1 Tax=Gorillibacterium sp. CAU 1737 TaxID=3140362 RepID=UPI003260E100
MNIQSASASPARTQQVNGGNSDSALKAIQSQIADLKQKLESLSANKEMSKEAKDARRKELQQQIQELNKQLMQRRAEIREEQRQKVAEAAQRRESAQPKTQEEQDREELLASVHNAVGISTSMQQMKTRQTVKTRLEGEARVLGAEVKTDRGRGLLVAGKEDKLGELNSQIDEVTMDLMGDVSKVNKKLKEVRESDSEDAKQVDKTEKAEEEKEVQASGVSPLEEGPLDALREKSRLSPDAPPSSKRKEKGQYVDRFV